jgi:RNA polymerase sigma factor for flagellar operon FliA
LSEASLPAALIPSEPEAPDSAYERTETSDRVRAAIASLPAREQKVIGLYYYQEATMKQIGAEIGVNESRVSQLHARAIRRLKDALHKSMSPAEAATVLAFHKRERPVEENARPHLTLVNPARKTPAIVVPHPSVNKRPAAPKKSLVAKKRAAMAVATVTKMTRRPAEVVAIAR